MAFDIGKFVGTVVGMSVGVILTAAMLPVIAGVTIPEGVANSAAIEAMLGVVPLLFVVGIVLAGVYAFISRRA